MRPFPIAAALAAAFAATAAFAQNDTSVKTGPSPTSGSDAGFFRPQPDASLTAPPPPAVPEPDAAPQPPAAPAAPAFGNARVQSAAVDPEEQLRRTEDEMDRAEREARLARSRELQLSPAPINGAFSGMTDEHDR